MERQEKALEELAKIESRTLRPTSDADLMYMLGDAIKIVVYDQIKNFKTLDELLSPFGAVIILYPNPSHTASDSKVGHWCTLFQSPGTNVIQFFDSYGCFLDDKVKNFNENDTRVRMHQKTKIEPALIELILASPYADTTNWNDYPFQSTTTSTASCGLWCVCRLKFNHLDEEGFKALFLDAPKKAGREPDDLVAELIRMWYPEKS